MLFQTTTPFLLLLSPDHCTHYSGTEVCWTGKIVNVMYVEPDLGHVLLEGKVVLCCWITEMYSHAGFSHLLYFRVQLSCEMA